MTDRPVAVGLFYGAGGFSKCLEGAGFDIIRAVDSDGASSSVSSPGGRPMDDEEW
jgi:site-specific DNA-cytosine methylase